MKCLIVSGLLRGALVGALFGALAGGGCDRGSPGQTGASGPVDVRAGVAENRDLPRVIPAVGSLRANHRVNITTEIPGDLVALHFTDGQLVKQGDPIATIDDTEQQADVAKTKADLARTEFEFTRTQRAQQQQAATDLELKTAQANRDAAAAAVKAAEAVLAKCQLAAPFDGRLSKRLVDPGAFIASGTAIVQLESLDALLVDFEVPEEDLTLLKVGQPVKLVFEGLEQPGQTIIASITAIGPQVKSASHSLPVRAALPEVNPALSSGMFARAEVQVGTRSAVVVPTSAVVFGSSSASVWVISGAQATQRRVKTGVQLNDAIEIKSGLAAGERVVTAGTVKLGASPTAIREVAPPPASPAPPPAGSGAAPPAGSGAAPPATPGAARSGFSS